MFEQELPGEGYCRAALGMTQVGSGFEGLAWQALQLVSPAVRANN